MRMRRQCQHLCEPCRALVHHPVGESEFKRIVQIHRHQVQLFRNDQPSSITGDSNMRCAGVFFIVLLLAAWISPASRSDHVRWVEESLRSMQSIQPGMTRADLNKLFVAEGGIGSRTERVYVLRTRL